MRGDEWTIRRVSRCDGGRMVSVIVLGNASWWSDIWVDKPHIPGNGGIRMRGMRVRHRGGLVPVTYEYVGRTEGDWCSRPACGRNYFTTAVRSATPRIMDGVFNGCRAYLLGGWFR